MFLEVCEYGDTWPRTAFDQRHHRMTKFHVHIEIRYIAAHTLTFGHFILDPPPAQWQVNIRMDRDFPRASFTSSFRFMAAIQSSLLLAPVPHRLSLSVS